MVTSNKPIVLLGLMTSGKSSLGRKLAQNLNFEFIDLDEYISAQVNMSIQKIFNSYGEGYFRKLEQESLMDTLSSENCVIALGGGTPCYLGNMDMIRQYAQSIYLKVSKNEIIRRARHSHTMRPLIEGLDQEGIAQVVEDQLNSRESYYLLADHIIESDQIDLAMIRKCLISPSPSQTH